MPSDLVRDSSGVSFPSGAISGGQGTQGAVAVVDFLA